MSAGTPVPSGSLPCGDITPTVGIVGTPVIDTADGVLYAVADTWNGSDAQHLLEGFRISDGEGFSVPWSTRRGPTPRRCCSELR